MSSQHVDILFQVWADWKDACGKIGNDCRLRYLLQDRRVNEKFENAQEYSPG